MPTGLHYSLSLGAILIYSSAVNKQFSIRKMHCLRSTTKFVVFDFHFVWCLFSNFEMPSTWLVSMEEKKIF